MTTVFANSMVAHVWAQGNQNSGRSNNGQFYFEGKFLYSYGTHYTVGYRFENGLVLINEDSNSVTTERHKSHAWNATTGATRYSIPRLTELSRAIHCADSVESIFSNNIKSTYESAILAIFLAMGLTKKDATSRAKRAFKAQAKKLAASIAEREKADLKRMLDGAKHSAGLSNRYVQKLINESASSYDGKNSLVEMGRNFLRESKAAKNKGWTQIAAKCRANYKTVRIAVDDFEQREFLALKNQNRRMVIGDFRQFAESCIEYKNGDSTLTSHAALRLFTNLESTLVKFARLAPVLSRKTLERVQSLLDGTRAEIVVLSNAVNVEKFTQQAESRAKFRNGEPVGYEYLLDESGAALIRAENVERDESGAIIGGILRTSQRATVPLIHALKAFRFLKLCAENGREWTKNGKSLRVGHFAIDHVDSQGNFKAGCHRINYSEVTRLAESLNVATLESTDTTESN